MSDTNQNLKIEDLDTLTDDQIRLLDVPSFSETSVEVSESTVEAAPVVEATEGSEAQEPKQEDEVTPVPEEKKEELPEVKKVQEKEASTVPTEESVDIAKLFYEKISTPFKADGKEIKIRTPEEAVRLMQMGANYSRRMQEIKPLKAMDQLLKQHGLNDPEKLNFLIDIHKGKVDAIQKLLKDHKIDPIDIDTDKVTNYRTPDYSIDQKDLDFKEAIEETINSEGGKDLIEDINKEWDSSSKSALREQPEIFKNLLAQKTDGVYEKIKEELEHQRTLGYLINVPFLQAYHQVGIAMEKAGVFKKPTDQLNKVDNTLTPIDTGIRKAPTTSTVEQPTPKVSSPKIAPNPTKDRQEIDYFSMSDADFLKLSAPH